VCTLQTLVFIVSIIIMWKTGDYYLERVAEAEVAEDAG